MRSPDTERNRNQMTRYYRVMLGKGSIYAAECFAGEDYEDEDESHA